MLGFQSKTQIGLKYSFVDFFYSFFNKLHAKL